MTTILLSCKTKNKIYKAKRGCKRIASLYLPAMTKQEGMSLQTLKHRLCACVENNGYARGNLMLQRHIVSIEEDCFGSCATPYSKIHKRPVHELMRRQVICVNFCYGNRNVIEVFLNLFAPAMGHTEHPLDF